jgi:hypothetical protein
VVKCYKARIVYIMISAASAAPGRMAASTPEVHLEVEVSSNDEVMDWSDNIRGIKELYEEGRQLELKVA